MRTKHSGHLISRVGQGRSNRTAPLKIPPKATLVAPPRPIRDWAKQNERLVARGDVEIWVNLEDLTGRGSGLGSGCGRPFPVAAISVLVVLQAIYQLPLRQTEGLGQFLVRSLRRDCSVPDYSTICRRRRELAWDPPRLRRGQVIAVDATGITVRSTGPWLADKGWDKSKSRFVKLHAGIDQQTGEILSFVVTKADGQGSGDVSVGPRLIREAARVNEDCAGVLADRAYDAKTCYVAAKDTGTTLYAVPKDTAVRGLHPDRDTHLDQIGRVGPSTWKRRVGYGQRAQVESVFSALKRTTGDRTRARSFEGALAEIKARVWLYNQRLDLYPIR